MVKKDYFLEQFLSFEGPFLICKNRAVKDKVVQYFAFPKFRMEFVMVHIMVSRFWGCMIELVVLYSQTSGSGVV